MTEWTDVAPAADFGPGQARLIDVSGAQIAVINLEGQYYALEDACTHDGWPLLGCGLKPEEVMEGEQLVCPRHGARFCIRTGAALTPPAYEPLHCFPVRVNDGMVQIRDDRGP